VLNGQGPGPDQFGWPDRTGDAMAPEARLLTACAWCQRVKVNERWVTAEDAIRELRTYDWPEAPLFTHGICEHCLGFVSAAEPPADADMVPSKAA
jgi:hypothetical protein